MEVINKTEKYYQLLGQYYFSDGVYCWEEVDAQCDTLEQCLRCKEYAINTSPEYVDFMIEYRVVTEICEPEYYIESDLER